MPLAAASYFRGPQNTGDSALVDGTSLAPMAIRLFSDFQKILSPEETPFSSSMGTGKAINQKKVEWLNRFLAAHQVTLGANIADGVTETITLAAGEGKKVQKTDLLRIDDERIWVKAVSGDTITGKRGMGGSTATTHTNGTVALILAPAAQENADTPISPIAKGALEYNYPQLMDYGVFVSNREDVTPDYEFNDGSKYDAYLEQVMKDAAIDFEINSIHGRRGAEDSMVLGTGSPTLMGGLDFFTDADTNLAGAALTETVFNTVAQEIWTRVGANNMPRKFIVGPFMRRVISSLWNANRYATVRDKTTTLVWDRVETDFGPIDFTLSRYIPNGMGFFVKMEDIKKHPYVNGEWKDVMLPADGPYKKGRFTGDYTIVFLNNATRHKLINISTNAADYPNL